MMFSNAIVKTPCNNMINGICSAGLGRPDYDLARNQHDAYIKALKSCGLDVEILDADEAFPDSTFIEDTCLVTPHCIIITNPGADSRKGEVVSVQSAVENIGRPVEKILSPGTLDAGDVMMVKDHYYIGLSDRTNTEGAHQLEKILDKYKMTSSTVSLKSVLHLKTGVSYLERNNLLCVGEFLTKSELQQFNLLSVEDEEAYAANSVWINDTVLVPEGFPETLKMIQNEGYKTIEINVSEFRKLDGGPSCLSLRF